MGKLKYRSFMVTILATLVAFSMLLQENARKNLLQASEGEVNIIITFDSEVKDVCIAGSAEDSELEKLYGNFCDEEPGGGTDMYLALEQGLEMIAQSYDVSAYTPALILMTDGESEDDHKQEFVDLYREKNLDIPVFPLCSEMQIRHSWRNLRS